MSPVTRPRSAQREMPLTAVCPPYRMTTSSMTRPSPIACRSDTRPLSALRSDPLLVADLCDAPADHRHDRLAGPVVQRADVHTAEPLVVHLVQPVEDHGV